MNKPAQFQYGDKSQKKKGIEYDVDGVSLSLRPSESERTHNNSH
jgi:hypothetical protein